MSKEQARRFYEATYQSAHEPNRFFEDQCAQKVEKYIRPFIKDCRTILDYGCGPGGKLAALIGEGFEVFAHDVNHNFVQYAISHGLKPWDQSFRYDCVFLSHTIEHWINPFDDLAVLLEQNLQPGGRVVIEVPLVDRLILGDRRGGFREETHLAHVWYFSVNTLSALMGRLGCQLIFSDHVTTCIFQKNLTDKRSAELSSPWRTRGLLATVASARLPVIAAVLRRLNRIVKFVNIDFRRVAC